MDLEGEEEISFYVLLNVKRDASKEDINKAFKKWALMYHPDKIPEDDVAGKAAAQSILARVNLAKETLLDDEKRKVYDALGEEGLKQLARPSEEGDKFRERLEQARIDREVARHSEVAKPNGQVAVSLNATDTFTALRNRHVPGVVIWPPEVSYMSAGTQFTHTVNDNWAVQCGGTVATTVHEPAAHWKGDALYGRRGPSSSVHMRLSHTPSASEERAVRIDTDGQSIASELSIAGPISGTSTSCSATVGHSTSDGAVRAVLGLHHPLWSYGGDLEGEGRSTGTATARIHINGHAGLPLGEAMLDVVNKGKTGIRVGAALPAAALEHNVSFRSRLPRLVFQWRRYGAAAFHVSASMTGDVSFGYSITRSPDRHTRISIGSEVGIDGGFGWTFQYKRARQSVSVPIHVTDEMPSPGWLIGLFVAPFVVDWITQSLLLRPYYSRQRALRTQELLDKYARAQQEQRFMQREALDRRRTERDNRGIVILQARFGLADAIGTPRAEQEAAVLRGDLPSWVGVHWVLQTRVSTDTDYSRLVMTGDLSRLPGFVDLAPDRAKVLDVHYLYNGVYHHATIEEDENVVLPSQDHRDVDVAWRDAQWDWPLDSIGDQESAEGAAGGYSGVD